MTEEIVIPDIVIDSREPESLFVEISKACEGKIVVREAASTDIIIPGGFAFERKEISDFISTWQDNRLYEQLATLKNFQDNGYKVALMLVGDQSKALRYRKMKPMALLNMIASIYFGWGITVLPVPQSWQVPYVVKYALDKTSGEKKNYKIAKAAPRDATPAEQAVYVLQSMPGVGTKVSEKVVAETPNLYNFIKRLGDYSIFHQSLPLTEKQRDKLYEVITADWKKTQDDPKEIVTLYGEEVIKKEDSK